MVNGLHLYSAFIQSALQFLPLIHPFTHTFTHQRRLAAMQGTNQFVRSNRGLGVSLRDTSTRPGWDRTGNPPTARRQLYLLSHMAPHCDEGDAAPGPLVNAVLSLSSCCSRESQIGALWQTARLLGTPAGCRLAD